MRGMPTVAKLLHAGRMATFADVLAMMVDQRVPLDEAVVLSAEASGDRILKEASAGLAESIRSGTQRAEVSPAFPPLLAWMRVLEQAHVAYDVIAFGHPDLWDDSEALDRLDRYETAILPRAVCMSESQRNAVAEFV